MHYSFRGKPGRGNGPPSSFSSPNLRSFSVLSLALFRRFIPAISQSVKRKMLNWNFVFNKCWQLTRETPLLWGHWSPGPYASCASSLNLPTPGLGSSIRRSLDSCWLRRESLRQSDAKFNWNSKRNLHKTRADKPEGGRRKEAVPVTPKDWLPATSN